MIKEWGSRCDLFLSGTASIVNYETQHVSDFREQVAETLRNIRALLGHAADVTGQDFQTEFAEGKWKVYLRNAEDFSLIQDTLWGKLRENAGILYLHGDLCRRELLFEIEGVCTRRHNRNGAQ